MNLLLAFCLCFAMAMPAFATETYTDIVSDVEEYNADIALLSEMQSTGRFYNLTDLSADEIAAEQSNIARQVNALAVEAEQEFADMDVDLANGLPITVEVTEINDDYTYVYSQTEGEDAQVVMYETAQLTEDELLALQEKYQVEAQTMNYEESEDNEIDLLSDITRSLTGCSGPCGFTKDIPGGLGARLPMTYNNGTVLSFTVDTSNTADTIEPLNGNGQSLNGACYLYGGFDATCNGKACNSDLGLIYQKLKGTNTWAWKPFYRVSYTDSNGNAQSIMENTNTNDENGKPGQVWGANGYIPGEVVKIQIRIDAVGSKSDVVLRTEGNAFHATSEGTGGRTYLVQATRYKNNGNYFPKITNANKWKLLAHPANNNSSTAKDSQIVKAYVAGDFTNIRINNAIPTFGTVDRDYGYAQKIGSDHYWLQSCKGI